MFRLRLLSLLCGPIEGFEPEKLIDVIFIENSSGLLAFGFDAAGDLQKVMSKNKMAILEVKLYGLVPFN